MEHNRDLKLSSEHVSPFFSCFEVSKNSKSCSMTVEPDDFPHSVENLNHCIKISDKMTFCISGSQENDFYEKSINSCLPLEKEIGIPGNEFGTDKTITISSTLESSTILCRGEIAPSLDTGKVYSGKSYGDITFKEGDYDHESEIKASDFTSPACNCDVCRNASIKCILLREKDIFSGGISPHLKKAGKLKETINASLDSSEEADLINAKCLRNQILSAKKYSRESNLFPEKQFQAKKDSKAQKDYFEDSGQTNTLVEAKKLLKCEDPKIQKEYSEEYDQSNYLTKVGIYLKMLEESKIKKEHFESIHTDERENDFLKSEYSEVEADYSPEKTRNYDVPDDDCLLEELCDAFNFICKVEENASSCIGKQNFISETMVECEEIHSEPYCVKSVRILLHFLEDVKSDLESKKKVAFELKLVSEAQVKQIDLYDLENTKEGKELKEIANNFVINCAKMCASIEKDMTECVRYGKYLKKMQNFFHENCCFISTPAI